MTAADSLAAYTHAVELVQGMLESPTPERADNLYRKVVAAYIQVYGPAHAREVGRQARTLVDGALALRAGVEP